MYNLNINKSSVVPTNLIVGRVLDKPFDTFQFKIFDGLDPLDLTGATLDFRGVTPDNKKVISTNVKITDARSGEIEFQLPTNFYSAQGQFRNAYFRINKSGLTESTNDLLINVLNAVDLNLDDSQVIIDQLDKIIEDAINKLDKELANIKALLQKEKENIEQLKKDVASYKQTFDKQMADMQKQIDDLRGIINSTDVQRPQITQTDGNYLKVINDDSSNTITKLKELGMGVFSLYIIKLKDAPESYMTGIYQATHSGDVGRLVCTSTSTGNIYSYNHNDGKSGGWKKLNGQVPKITNDNGNYNLTISDVTKDTIDILKSNPMGIYSVYVDNAKDLPERYMTGIYQSTHAGNTGRLICTSTSTGNIYSYNHNDGKSGGWKKLNGQVPKITEDNGNYNLILSDSSKSTMELLKPSGMGIYSIYLNNASDLPERYMTGIYQATHSGDVGRLVCTSTSTGNIYSYNHNDGKSGGWKKLNGQVPKITEDNGAPKLIVNNDSANLEVEFPKLGDGVHYVYLQNTKLQPERYIKGIVTIMGGGNTITFNGVSIFTNNLYTWTKTSTTSGDWKSQTSNVVNLLNQEAYYGVDGFLLDKLTNYEFVDITARLSGNSVTTRYEVSPDVNFEIPLTNVYNDTNSTGFDAFEIQGSINDTRVTVSRSKGVKVSNTTTALNNTSDIKIVGIYGVNKIK